nr:MAG TPA: hypothetical protein [Caudoviricetes sp.]
MQSNSDEYLNFNEQKLKYEGAVLERFSLMALYFLKNFPLDQDLNIPETTKDLYPLVEDFIDNKEPIRKAFQEAACGARVYYFALNAITLELYNSEDKVVYLNLDSSLAYENDKFFEEYFQSFKDELQYILKTLEKEQK